MGRSRTVCGPSGVVRKLLVGPGLVMICQTIIQMALAKLACGGGTNERGAVGVIPKVVDQAGIAVDHRPENAVVGAVGDQVEC